MCSITMVSLKLVSLFLVQLITVLATPPPLPVVTDLPHEQWNELYQRAVLRLEQLATEQGQQFKLLRIDNAQEQIIAGHRYSIEGRFQTATGEEIDCTYDLWKAASDGFEEYNLYCGKNEYRWSLGQRAS